MTFWIVGGLAALLVGVAKTGVPGLGILAVPLMFIAVEGVVLSNNPGPGTLLPLLCLADAVAVLWFRRSAEARRLWELAPWVIAGLVVGAVVMRFLDAHQALLRALVGGIVLAMVLLHLWRSRNPNPAVGHGWSHHALFGVTAGTATMIAHAAGPVMSLYLLSMALPKAELIGTGAWFFLVINLLKVPWYGFDSMITAQTLVLDLWLAPVVLLGCVIGGWLSGRISQRLFDLAVLVLAALGGAYLLIPR